MMAPDLARPDATELGNARRRIEQLVGELPGGDQAERSFDQPWQIRAFAMAVAAYQQRQFEWSEFQLSLISSIRDWEAGGGRAEDDPWSYYQHWLAALETVLSGSGLLSESALDEQTKQVLALPPNRNHHKAYTEPVAVDRAR